MPVERPQQQFVAPKNEVGLEPQKGKLQKVATLAGGVVVGVAAGYAVSRALRNPHEAPFTFSPLEQWRKDGKSLLDYYHLENSQPFEKYVDDLEAETSPELSNKKDYYGFLKKEDFEAAEAEVLDKQILERDLSKMGMTMEQFTGAVKLAMLTECATESYSPKFVNSGKRKNQPWLGRFTEKIWVPDELSHADPFRILLLKLGVSEAEIERDIKVAQEANYNYGDEHSPVAITTFGWLQEYLTDHYHGLIAKTVKNAAPKTSHLITAVKKRETLHTMWYRDMTAMQVGQNPDLIVPVVASLRDFHLPGNEVAPGLQDRATEFLKAMGADFGQVKKNIIRHVYGSLGDLKNNPRENMQNAGKLVLEMAAQSGTKIGPFSAEHMQIAFSKNAKYGAAGETLFGEALLEAAGLGEPIKKQDVGTPGKIRALARTKGAVIIGEHLDKTFNQAA